MQLIDEKVTMIDPLKKKQITEKNFKLKSIIKNINDEFKFIIDPHTATGFGAAEKIKGLDDGNR